MMYTFDDLPASTSIVILEIDVPCSAYFKPPLMCYTLGAGDLNDDFEVVRVAQRTMVNV